MKDVLKLLGVVGVWRMRQLPIINQWLISILGVLGTFITNLQFIFQKIVNKKLDFMLDDWTILLDNALVLILVGKSILLDILESRLQFLLKWDLMVYSSGDLIIKIKYTVWRTKMPNSSGREAQVLVTIWIRSIIFKLHFILF